MKEKIHWQKVYNVDIYTAFENGVLLEADQ